MAYICFSIYNLFPRRDRNDLSKCKEDSSAHFSFLPPFLFKITSFLCSYKYGFFSSLLWILGEQSVTAVGQKIVTPYGDKSCQEAVIVE